MKAFLDLFRRNWGLKLLALVLAIVIYYSVRDTINAPQHGAAPTFLKGPAS